MVSSCKSEKQALNEAEASKVKREKGPSAPVRNLFTFHLSLLTCLLLALSGCDESFQPLQENDTAPFSIYGYLDASADTQWVRVTPVRDELNMPPVKPEMDVTLEHLQSDSTTVMNDSLFLSDAGFNFLNVWTTMDIKPGHSYRLKAERPDGLTSRATVTLPEEFPTPVLFDYGDGCRALMRIEGVERLADVQSKWHVRILFLVDGEVIFEREGHYTIPHRDRATRVAAGAYTVFIDTRSERDEIMNQLFVPSGTAAQIQVLQRQLFVASGGPEWIEDIASLDDVVYALPEGLSNVENGIGYMVGIVSKTIPYESCFE